MPKMKNGSGCLKCRKASIMPSSVTLQKPPDNAMLNYYAAFMDQEKIRRNWKISLPGELHITDTELCSLLGNLLENVCHGCQTLPADERFHCLTIQLQHGNCLYIVSSNTLTALSNKKMPLTSPHKREARALVFLRLPPLRTNIMEWRSFPTQTRNLSPISCWKILLHFPIRESSPKAPHGI